MCVCVCVYETFFWRLELRLFSPYTLTSIYICGMTTALGVYGGKCRS